MASANLELVRSMYGAWEGGDFSSVEWAHPEIEYVVADGPSPGTWTGLEGMAEGVRDQLNAWEDLRVEAEEFRELDNHRVLVLTQLSGSGRTSGLELGQMRSKGAALFDVRGAKVTRYVFYFDRERALADLGLTPEARSVSPENVALARQMLDAVARRDLARLIALTDPEVEWHSFFALGEKGGVYRGHEGLRQYVSDLYDAWEIVRPEVDEALGVGAVAVLIGRVHYRGRASGVDSESPAGWVFKFRDASVLSFRAFGEPEQTLEALGLPG